MDDNVINIKLAKTEYIPPDGTGDMIKCLLDDVRDWSIDPKTKTDVEYLRACFLAILTNIKTTD